MTTWRTARWLGRPWQDLTFAVGEVVFLVSVFPLLLDEHSHVPALTGFATSFMLYCLAVAHVSYRNWITVGFAVVTATLWLLLGLGVVL